MRTDLHQHLLPEPLIGALARRSAAPRVVGSGPSLRLELAGEPDSALQERDHDPVARAAEAEREGIDRVVVSLSTALGIEALPADEARPLLDAFNHGILELGDAVRAVGRRARRGRRRRAARRRRARDHAPRPGAGGRAGAEAALLDRLEARGAPLFVHPGPAARRRRRRRWWPAMTDYVAR